MEDRVTNHTIEFYIRLEALLSGRRTTQTFYRRWLHKLTEFTISESVGSFFSRLQNRITNRSA